VQLLVHSPLSLWEVSQILFLLCREGCKQLCQSLFKKGFLQKSPLTRRTELSFSNWYLQPLKLFYSFLLLWKFAFFNSIERAFVIAPEPQPKSAITGSFIFDEILIVSSTRNSVSALGMSDPFLTKTSVL